MCAFLVNYVLLMTVQFEIFFIKFYKNAKTTTKNKELLSVTVLSMNNPKS